MGIDVSGDSVIRLIKKHAEKLDISCSEVIGVDDWAYKKGHTYGTIICDEKNHRPIELLDGRDGSELKEWLQNNRQIKMVTRDRASAFAKVISEVLPDAMQIADRFHLHQNLLNPVKEALAREIPNKIAVQENIEEHNVESESQYSDDKKKRTD